MPGHEPLGVIERIGDRAAKRWGVDVGDRVAVETPIRAAASARARRALQLLSRRAAASSRTATSRSRSRPACGVRTPTSCTSIRYSIVHRMRRTFPPSTAVMFNPLGAGFRWAVELPDTGPVRKGGGW